MRPRLGGAYASPTSFATKEKSHPPLSNEVTNGSDAAAMIYRMDPGSNGARKQGSGRHRPDRSKQGSTGSPVGESLGSHPAHCQRERMHKFRRPHAQQMSKTCWTSIGDDGRLKGCARSKVINDEAIGSSWHHMLAVRAISGHGTRDTQERLDGGRRDQQSS
jgi:hypothetical protein